MNIQSVLLDSIDVGERLRSTDADYVAWIADNFREHGQLQPILVRPGEVTGRYRLVDGGHRLEAARLAGLPRIRAIVLEDRDDEAAELLEIDANLVRADLSPLDRAVFLGRRAAIYASEHPETERGKAGAAARWHANDTLSFASDAEEKLGIGQRTIQRAIQVARGLKPELRHRLAGTWLARDQGQLLALAKLDPAEQAKAVELLLHPVQPRRNVAEAQREVRGIQVPEIAIEAVEMQRLLTAWRKAGRAARMKFIDHLVAVGELTVDRQERAA